RLTLRRGAGIGGDVAIGADAYRHTLIGAKPGGLDGIADADADVAALRQRRLLAFGEGRVVHGLERHLLAFRIVAAVIDDRPAVAENDADVVGHLFGRDEVAPANLGGIEPEFLGDALQEPLHDENR